MATAKKSRGKAGSRAKKPMKKASARSAKKATKPTAKKATKRGPRKVAKKTSAKKANAKQATSRGPVKKRASSNASANPLSRVARVAKEIAHQTTVAVSEGVDKVKEVSESIVERVTG